MADYLYRAKITHTEKTVEQLYKMQYYVYEKPRMILRALIGFALVAAAVALTVPTWGKALMILFGAWLLVSRDFPAAVRADRALSERKAKLPDMSYGFGPDKVHLSGEGSMDLSYKKFTRLVEDKQYLYLFVSRNSVCMMNKDSVKPADLMAFAKFMEDRTGLKWRAEKSFLSMSIYELRQAFGDMRNKK